MTDKIESKGRDLQGLISSAPISERLTGKGSDYRGAQTVTRNRYKC